MKTVIDLHDCINQVVTKEKILSQCSTISNVEIFKVYKRLSNSNYNFVSFHEEDDANCLKEKKAYNKIREIEGKYKTNGAGQLFVINPYHIRQREINKFVPMWDDSSQYMIKRQGFIKARLFMNIFPSNKIKLVSIAEWSREDLFYKNFSHEGFKAIISQFENIFSITFNRKI